MLVVGKCLKAHGIRGDIKVESYMDSPKSFCDVKEVIIKDTAYFVEKARDGGAFILLKLKGVETMSDAESFRNDLISVERIKMPKLKEGRYYIDDIIGGSVIVGEKYIGILDDVLKNGSADVYVVNNGKNLILFPLVDGILKNVDLGTKTIFIDEQVFAKVAVHED